MQAKESIVIYFMGFCCFGLWGFFFYGAHFFSTDNSVFEGCFVFFKHRKFYLYNLHRKKASGEKDVISMCNTGQKKMHLPKLCPGRKTDLP